MSYCVFFSHIILEGRALDFICKIHTTTYILRPPPLIRKESASIYHMNMYCTLHYYMYIELRPDRPVLTYTLDRNVYDYVCAVLYIQYKYRLCRSSPIVIARNQFCYTV